MIIQPTLPGNHPEDLKCLGGNSNNNNFLAACPPNTMNKRCQCATRSFLLVYPATPRGMYPRDSEDLGVERNNNKYLLVMIITCPMTLHSFLGPLTTSVSYNMDNLVPHVRKMLDDFFMFVSVNIYK